MSNNLFASFREHPERLARGIRWNSFFFTFGSGGAIAIFAVTMTIKLVVKSVTSDANAEELRQIAFGADVAMAVFATMMFFFIAALSWASLLLCRLIHDSLVDRGELHELVASPAIGSRLGGLAAGALVGIFVSILFVTTL